LAQCTESVLESSVDSEAASCIRPLLDNALERLDEELQACESGEANSETIADLFRYDVPRKLLVCMQALDFEDRKAATRLLDKLIRRAMTPNSEATDLVEEHVRDHPDLLKHLLAGCGKQEVFFLCSQLVKSFARSCKMAKALLDWGAADNLLELALHDNFDIASEAFAALREVLVAYPAVSADYVQEHASTFFPAYHLLLRSEDNYVIQRQALRLLGEMLLDVSFQEVMCDYVQNEQYLRLHMNLLIDVSVAIQLEAFHIFKLFVANPFKPQRVQSILLRNRQGLIKKIRSLSELQREDEHFSSDVAQVLEALASLQD